MLENSLVLSLSFNSTKVRLWPILIQKPTEYIFVSILQKYDYDYTTMGFRETSVSFQFYKSTIMTYGNYNRLFYDASFQFYKSTIMTSRRSESFITSFQVSILQKYDYDYDFKLWQTDVLCSFQFYKSTIMTLTILSLIRLPILVSILQKYDYDQERIKNVREDTTFQFYKSTIMTSLLPLLGYYKSVSILQKYDYDTLSLCLHYQKLRCFNSTKVRLWRSCC